MKYQQQPSSDLKKAWLYFGRSVRLQCPVCGQAPLFKPVRQVKSLNDWFQTLPGCPYCNYAYDREPGYFMMAIWSFDYGAAAMLGIFILLMLYNYFQLSTWQMLLFTLMPTFIFAVLFVRHAKTFYLAIDHYFFHDDGS